MMKMFLGACLAAILAMSTPVANAQQVTQSQAVSLDSFTKGANGHYDAQGKYSCSQVHAGVCQAYCKDNKLGGVCYIDCDGRQKYCLATGSYLIRKSSGTLANNLKKE
jgi:hypothetical protein